MEKCFKINQPMNHYHKNTSSYAVSIRPRNTSQIASIYSETTTEKTDFRRLARTILWARLNQRVDK